MKSVSKSVFVCVFAGVLIALVYIGRAQLRRFAEPSSVAAARTGSAHRVESDGQTNGKTPVLPDLRLPAYGDFLAGNSDVLRSLRDLYNDQHEADIFAVATAVKELESYTGIEIPRGDIVGVQMGLMT